MLIFFRIFFVIVIVVILIVIIFLFIVIGGLNIYWLLLNSGLISRVSDL